MFVITIETGFKAYHQLTMASGEKEDLHDHNWLVRSAVSADALDESGLAIDFLDLKAKIEAITTPFEGANLENLACFKEQNASAELVAKYIYDELEPLLSSGVMLEYIEVMEAAGCWAKYLPKPVE